jgi:hypothetical protein
MSKDELGVFPKPRRFLGTEEVCNANNALVGNGLGCPDVGHRLRASSAGL